MRFEFVRERVTPVFKHQSNSQEVTKTSYYAPRKLSRKNRKNVLSAAQVRVSFKFIRELFQSGQSSRSFLLRAQSVPM